MKLIVGLGNPGKEYDNTRHNVGFQIIDSLCEALNLQLTKKKFQGQYIKFKKNNEDIIILKPLTYMNLSGKSINMFCNYFKINIADVIIIYDDIDLDLNTICLRTKGSSGGHNGIKNIIEMFGTSVFNRIKIGIGKNKNYETSDWVLSKFNHDEKIILQKIIFKVIEIFNDYFVDFDFLRILQKYN